MEIDKLLVASPKWVFVFLALVISGVIIHSYTFATCRTNLFGLKFGPEKSCEPSYPIESVLISSAPCNKLGGSWSEFEEASGRLIVGVGAATDQNSETRKFKPYQKGGGYTHKLLESQMPKHVHAQVWGQGSGKLPTTASGNDISTFNGTEIQSTSPKGGNEPHNNMPPFIALYFCKQY